MVFYFGFSSLSEIAGNAISAKFSYKIFPGNHAPAFRVRKTWPVTLAVEPSIRKINYSTGYNEVFNVDKT